MRYPLVIAALLLLFIRPTMCQAYDHATIVGEFYNYHFCDSCDRSLYRYEEQVYHFPSLNVGGGEAGVVLFDIPAEVKPFDHVLLQMYAGPPLEDPWTVFDVSVHGFDGATGNVGPSDLPQSVSITSPYSIDQLYFTWSIDVTDFLRAAQHSNVSFNITADTSTWTMAAPRLLVFPGVPEPASTTMLIIAALCVAPNTRSRRFASGI